MQMGSNRPLSKQKEAEKRQRSQRYDLISNARQGDAEAMAKLREKHGITKVWTQEEIKAYEDKA